jgi:hypothetical protein
MLAYGYCHTFYLVQRYRGVCSCCSLFAACIMLCLPINIPLLLLLLLLLATGS